MNEEEKRSLLNAINNTPLRSKKFIAAMTWNIVWLCLIGYGIHSSIDKSVLSSMVYIAGTVQCLYLGGQSAVDAIVRQVQAKAAIVMPRGKPET